ncbi:heavy metal-binding domain-containing protein [Lentzea sp. NPDC059081]|uniref:heavy metal-binding domain-containing protein n=1 Tax=Lentzea sp. NPDC059081 TaxID=3346719 RepID=UPI0036B7B17B
MIRAAGFTPLGPASGTAMFAGRVPHPSCGLVRDSSEVYPHRSVAGMWREGWATALTRLRERCTALGGDGVIGVRLTRQELGRRYEFTASGTVVRADGEIHPALPFTAHVDGREFVALMSAGWVPVGVVSGFAVVRGHLGWRLPVLAEQPEHTDTLTHAMTTARRAFADDALRQNATAVVVHDMSTHVGHEECREHHRTDVEAHALVVGTAITQFRAAAARPPLTIMPLHRGGTG